MTLSNGKIERLAVDAITSIANKPNSYLIPNIPVNDKGISFDGEISVFIDASEKKESLFGILPVQVKGTVVKHFTEGVRTYSLEIAHYQNFYKRDGALLFVVEVTEVGETKIFYKSLLSAELSLITQQFGNQKKRSVDLRPLEETTLYTVCRKFLNEQKYQPKHLVEKKPIPEQNFTNFVMTSLTFDPKHHAPNSIFDHNFTVYGILNDTHFPLHFGKIVSLETTGIRRFVAEGDQFDLSVEISREAHKTIIVVEDIFYFEIDVKNRKFHMRNNRFHSLEAQIKAMPFVIHLLSGHNIEFDGGMLSLNDDAWQFEGELQEMLEREESLNNLRNAFIQLGIPEKTVFLNTDDSDLYSALDFLTNSVLYNQIEGIHLENPEQIFLINFSVGNRLVVLFYHPHGEKKIISAFSEDLLKHQMMVHDSGDPFPHSVYIMLTVEALAQAINLDPQKICESFDQFNPFLHDMAFNLTNTFCLNCVSAFDQSGDYRLLEVAEHIYNKYKSAPIGPANLEQIVQINLYQVHKRKEGHLTEAENEHLYHLKIEAIGNHNTELLFCINVILENRIEAEFTFSQFEQQKKELYYTLPIYTLYNNLVSR